jgi:hypothetical protein
MGLFSDFFLSLFVLVYRKATDFPMLILYLLCQKCLSDLSFLVASSGFSHYRIMSSANRDNSASSLPICIPFVSFSCLIMLAKNSSSLAA